MDGWTVAWVFWIVGFFVIEMPAVFNKTEGDTLTEHITKWFSLKDKAPGWVLRRLSLLAGLGWLCYHFISRFGG